MPASFSHLHSQLPHLASFKLSVPNYTFEGLIHLNHNLYSHLEFNGHNTTKLISFMTMHHHCIQYGAPVVSFAPGLGIQFLTINRQGT